MLDYETNIVTKNIINKKIG